ncbi:uncharacterized protein LOC123563476 isoform X2 [Mercenaria mercenaria]|nr:uncharacterized protein LOC123563476 isoform X2 [Mercenaria mercenaria]
MATQNTNMCSDSVLATTVCPNYCNRCPMTCYNCNISTADVSACNTVTCSNNKVCMIKEIKSMRTGQHRYTLGCETEAVCDGERKRSLESRSVHIDCCVQDLCNNPSLSESTTMGTFSKPQISPRDSTTHGMVTKSHTSPGTTTPEQQSLDCSKSTHGSTYVLYANKHINAPFTHAYHNLTATECKNHCSYTPTCRGFNYYTYYAGGVCQLISFTPYDKLHSVSSYEGCNYYFRKCF